MMKKDHKILINDFDRQESYNEFYSSISVLFRIASFIFLMAFLVMVVYVAFDSQTSFNSANLDYVFRNYTLILDEKRNDTVYSIKYNPDSSRTFALIGNGFALCGNSGVQLFSSTGRTTCTDSLKFKNPIMVSSDKYALIYDSGNYELAVYNAFSQVYRHTFDKPIRNVCMSSDGYFAVVTSSDEFNSIVELYNSDFKIINRFNKVGYVTDIDLADNCILIATAAVSEEFDKYSLQVQLYDFIADQTLNTSEFQTSLPLSCNISSVGYFVVCANETIICDAKNNDHIVYDYNEYTVSQFDVTSDQVVLLFDTPGFEIFYQIVSSLISFISVL